MAEIFPDEGLDLILGIFPKGGATVATTYIGLFTAFTATTVGTSAQTRSAYTEPSGGAYARQSIAASSWGAQGAGSGGRNTAAGQVTFPTATAVWGTVNGFFIGDTSTGAAGKLYSACNFDDTTAITLNTNDVVKITPTMLFGN